MKDFAKKEPVVVSMLVTALLGWLASFLVVHGVLTKTQASSLVQEILPTAVFLVLTGVGFVVRRWVTPAVGKIEQAVSSAGWLPPPIMTDIAKVQPDLAAALAILSAPARPPYGTPGSTNTAGPALPVPPVSSVAQRDASDAPGGGR